MINIYNTQNNKKEPLKPVKDGEIGMYVCGVTVYDYCHLGHARSAIIFDVIRRYLKYKGYKVKYVRNFTDVDDKIINKANAEGKGWKEIAERFIDEYYKDMQLLGVENADVEPKATEHIQEIIDMVKRLVDKGFAYESGGDIFFEINKFPSYGKLSQRKLDDLIAGARVDVNELKRNPLDFVLWKSSKEGEPAWDSPWGPGRPGWHIECSAMSIKHLGETFDIHGGGKDLVFPHHENEIAQSEAFTSVPFVKYWVHNGFVMINEEKMSKSLGNFFTIREIFEKFPCDNDVTRESLRYFLLSTHYRKPINFSDLSLRNGKDAVENFYMTFQKLKEIPKSNNSGSQESILKLSVEYVKRLEEAMEDDFNTADALGELNKFLGEVNKNISNLSYESAIKIREIIAKLGDILGLFKMENPVFAERRDQSESSSSSSSSSSCAEEPQIEDEINFLIQKREEARAKKDWAESDRIRKELADKGIILEDRPDGTTRVRR